MLVFMYRSDVKSAVFTQEQEPTVKRVFLSTVATRLLSMRDRREVNDKMPATVYHGYMFV